MGRNPATWSFSTMFGLGRIAWSLTMSDSPSPSHTASVRFLRRLAHVLDEFIQDHALDMAAIGLLVVLFLEGRSRGIG
ncbi:TPA: hypothetical protein DDZ10_02660 [Candidatus Uhrbacteria bacterium]|nr:hypothetical protein [Candidatus Uhrbacteria bacterium]